MSSQTYTVVLQKSGSDKLRVIKLIKERTGLGLKEAKDIVDNTPSKVTENISLQEANSICQILKEVENGIEVVVTSNDQIVHEVTEETDYFIKVDPRKSLPTTSENVFSVTNVGVKTVGYFHKEDNVFRTASSGYYTIDQIAYWLKPL